MKKIFLSLSILLAAAFTTGVNAQMSVGTSAAPNANAVLDLVSSNQGLLLPRVALTSTTSASPLSTHVAGMHVYNTATAGTSPNNVTPGEYYNDGTKWVRINEANTEWYLSSGTVDAGNNKAGSIYRTGNVGIGTTSPGTKLEINNGTTNGAVKIVDGTQGAGKVLTSDANGVGTWQVPAGTIITGVVPSTVTNFIPTTYSPQTFYTGTYITLPAGEWRIDMLAWIEASGTAVEPIPTTGINNGGFASLLLSKSNTVITPPAFAAANIKSVIIPNLYTQSLALYSKYGGGAIFVDLSTTTTLYLWAYAAVGFKSTTATLPDKNAFQLFSRNGDVGAYGPYTYIVATKI